MKRPLSLLLLLTAAACAGNAASSLSTPTPTPVASPSATPTPVIPNDPGGPGPLAFTSSANVTLPGAGADTATADIYIPAGSGPFPVVFLVPGFARSKANHVGNGEHFASWGFVTIVATPVSLTNFLSNSQDLVAFAQWAQGHPAALPASADPTRIAVMGHSAGGLTSILASQPTTPFQFLVGLDPVDDSSNQGLAAAPSVTLPAAFVLSEPSSCNAQSNALGIWSALAATPRERLKVTGANHCDFEDPTDGLCTAVCGNWDAGLHTVAMRYATSWLLVQLAGEESFAAWTMGSSAMATDTAISDTAAVF